MSFPKTFTQLNTIVQREDFSAEIQRIISWAETNASQEEKTDFLSWMENDWGNLHLLAGGNPEDWFAECPSWQELTTFN